MCIRDRHYLMPISRHFRDCKALLKTRLPIQQPYSKYRTLLFWPNEYFRNSEIYAYFTRRERVRQTWHVTGRDDGPSDAVMNSV